MAGDLRPMFDSCEAIVRRSVLSAIVIAIASCSGCGDPNAPIVAKEIAGKKAKFFEDARSKAVTKKGKSTAPRPRTTPVGDNR